MRVVAALTILACTLASPLSPAGADDACDALWLARLAATTGDAQLAARLAGADRDRALVGVRASAFAAAPELLVPALAELACGRDAVLAPEAAHVLRQLAARIPPSELAAREVLVADLASARAALACAGASPAPRADIVSALGMLTAQLDALIASSGR